MSDIAFRANPTNPCAVCGSGTKGCSATDDGLHLCRGEPRPYWRSVTPAPDGAGFGHYRRGDTRPSAQPALERNPVARSNDWSAEARKYAVNLTAARARVFTDVLKLPADALEALGLVGWNPIDCGGCWTFPETDTAGGIVGMGRPFPKPVSIDGASLPARPASGTAG